jgi:hypothetical protein
MAEYRRLDGDAIGMDILLSTGADHRCQGGAENLLDRACREVDASGRHAGGDD